MMVKLNIKNIIFIFLLCNSMSVLHPVSLSVLSLNAYCFDQGATNLLTAATSGRINLMDRTDRDSWERIDRMALFIRLQKLQPDVICFQELWMDEHKKHMINALSQDYPYWFYISRSENDNVKSFGAAFTSWISSAKSLTEKFSKDELSSLNPIKMDSGLLICSKKPFKKSFAITYPDSTGAERQAFKGAIGVIVDDAFARPVAIVTTHLQTGDTTIQEKQVQVLAALVKEQALPVTDRIVLCGDFNRYVSIYSYNNQRVLLDATFAFTEQLTSSIGKQFFTLVHAYDELKQKEQIAYSLFYDTRNWSYYRYDKEKNQYIWVEVGAGFAGPFPSVYSTNMEGNAILDNFICSQPVELEKMVIVRKKILGEAGDIKFDRATALTDHAAVIAAFK